MADANVKTTQRTTKTSTRPEDVKIGEVYTKDRDDTKSANVVVEVIEVVEVVEVVYKALPPDKLEDSQKLAQLRNLLKELD